MKLLNYCTLIFPIKIRRNYDDLSILAEKKNHCDKKIKLKAAIKQRKIIMFKEWCGTISNKAPQKMYPVGKYW